MRAGLTISIAGHVALVAWGLISFTSRPLKALTSESLPVDIISDKEFSEVTKGIKAAKQPNQKPLVEKVAENRPVEDPDVKISPKPEIKAANDATPPPQEKPEPKKEPPKEAKAEPKPKPPEPKPEPPKETKVEPKPKPEPPKEVKVEPKPEPKVDPIAEALKKEEAKKPEKQPEKQAEKKPPEAKKQPEEKKTAEAKPVTAEKTPPQEQKKLDFGKIASLLDKQTPQRAAAGGQQLNQTAALGLPTGNAVAITQSELDALRARMRECWLSPPGINSDRLAVEIRVSFNIDGSLSRPPVVLQGAASPYGVMVAESAKRAILRCQPYRMLRKETYEKWKEIDMTFDASWMNN